MPLPAPHGSQSKEEFVAACMRSDVIQSEFPTQQQRLAVCFSQWKRAHKTGDANWEDSEAAIQRDGIILTQDEARIVLPQAVPRETLEDGKPCPWVGPNRDRPPGGIYNDKGRQLKCGF